MRRIERGRCLQEYMDFLAGELLGPGSTNPDGSVETEEYGCGLPGCARACVLTGEVENGIVVKVKAVYGGGGCVVRAWLRLWE